MTQNRVTKPAMMPSSVEHAGVAVLVIASGIHHNLSAGDPVGVWPM